MRRTLLAAAVCIAGLVAGCGSSSKTPTTPAATGSGTTGTSASTTSTQMATTGNAGSMGPPTSGKYSATNSTVLQHIDAALVKYFTSKGFTGVTANCTGVNAAQASCKVTGTNKSGQTSSAVLTISVNQTTGQLKIVHVAT